jgi:putative protein kinase ArgK-like GTPase of G3E family
VSPLLGQKLRLDSATGQVFFMRSSFDREQKQALEALTRDFGLFLYGPPG